MTSHKCSRCGEDKPVEDFYKSNWICKPCTSADRKVFYRANRARIREYRSGYYWQYVHPTTKKARKAALVTSKS